MRYILIGCFLLCGCTAYHERIARMEQARVDEEAEVQRRETAWHTAFIAMMRAVGAKSWVYADGPDSADLIADAALTSCGEERAATVHAVKANFLLTMREWDAERSTQKLMDHLESLARKHGRFVVIEKRTGAKVLPAPPVVRSEDYNKI